MDVPFPLSIILSLTCIHESYYPSYPSCQCHTCSGGGLVLSDDEGEVPPELLEIQRKEAEERAALEAEALEEQERAKKSRIDDLWAELNGGTATPAPSASAPTTTAATAPASKTSSTTPSTSADTGGGKIDSSLAALLGTDEPVVAKPQKTAAQIAAELLAAKDKGNTEGSTEAKEGEVVIKETYDFAGRKVEVEKAVAANSHAAKKFSAKQGGSGIDKLLASLGKKKQMTTTTKSRLDWEKHTIETGTKADLQNAAKDGYLEKQAFLSRAEMREFEQRRTVNRKRLGIADD
eukprot:TRINITY_DN1703_c0_g1_i2.p1 TRINITY_DN1703_c0_g1~~TRINITY_DN1703_c0_g1_i2.p1  ORF type:complete len:292 (+),score=73.72 TRINITY_DN1703_c0_g1_i2:240-1115(+)